MAGQLETALAPQRNAVSIVLSSSTSRLERATITRAAAASAVRVDVTTVKERQIRLMLDGAAECNKFKENEAYCDKPITAGVTIKSEIDAGDERVVCTAGPMTIRTNRTTETLETFLLTAGHCIEKAEGKGIKWYAFNKAGTEKEIGTASEFINDKKADVGAILINNPGEWIEEAGNIPVFAGYAPWSAATPKAQPVLGEAAPVLNHTNCKEGQTSGETCGTIKNLSVTLEGTEKFVEDEKAQSEEKDSGGPWISTQAGSVNFAEGTTVGHKGVNGVYEPLKTAFVELAALGLSLELLTKANETRAACPMMK